MNLGTPSSCYGIPPFGGGIGIAPLGGGIGIAEPCGGNGIAPPPTIGGAGGGGIGGVADGGIGAWLTTGGVWIIPPNDGTGGNLTSKRGGVA